MVLTKQLEIISKTSMGIIVFEAQYDNTDSHWYWMINGIRTGYMIYRYEAEKRLQEQDLALIYLKQMGQQIKIVNTKTVSSFDSKQIRVEPFPSTYSMVLIRELIEQHFPEFLV